MVCQITGLASHQNVFEDAHSYATCMQRLISFHKKDGFKVEKCQNFVKSFQAINRTRAIITRGLYTFYPLFAVHLCTVTFGLMYD